MASKTTLLNMHHIVKKTKLEEGLISENRSLDLSQTDGTSVSLDVNKKEVGTIRQRTIAASAERAGDCCVNTDEQLPGNQ